MALLKDVVVEVWERIKMGATAAGAAGAAATAMFFDIKADAASGMQSAIESVVGFGNTAANTFEGAFEAIKAIWGLLPAAIGDLAFQAANSLIEGVESMLNGVVARINGFIEGINSGLEALGSERRITLLGDLDLGEIEHRFAGAATRAGTAAKDAFDRAFEDNPLSVPDFGLNDIARDALSSANTYRTAASDLAAGALAPRASWQALKDAVAGAGTEGVEAKRTDQTLYDLPPGPERTPAFIAPTVFGPPAAILMNLPQLADDIPAHCPYVAVFASPWYGSALIWRSPSTDGFTALGTVGQPACFGTLAFDFYAGPVWRFDNGNEVWVDVASGSFSSLDDEGLFTGSNALAIETAPGVWEIVQFGTAALQSPGRWKLTHLLRGSSAPRVRSPTLLRPVHGWWCSTQPSRRLPSAKAMSVCPPAGGSVRQRRRLIR